jgi:hypothetical protein
VPLRNPLNWAVGKPSPSPGPIRFPATVAVTGERVYIVDKTGTADQPILVAEDGRRFVNEQHGHKLIELAEDED